MTNYYHIFLYMFCKLFILFLFFMHLGVCHKRNFVVYTMTNKVLELERLPKSVPARTSTSASRTAFSDSVSFFFFALVILKHRNLDIGVCSFI